MPVWPARLNRRLLPLRTFGAMWRALTPAQRGWMVGITVVCFVLAAVLAWGTWVFLGLVSEAAHAGMPHAVVVGLKALLLMTLPLLIYCLLSLFWLLPKAPRYQDQHRKLAEADHTAARAEAMGAQLPTAPASPSRRRL